MADIKTIALNSAEISVDINGDNCDIRNDGTDIVYASTTAGVAAGADGVLSIPAGSTAKLLDCKGAVYLLGTGSVQLCGNDYSDQVFKVAATSSGGGGEDTVARTAINTHAANDEIHLTTDDAIEAAANTISNPNLLINPDFKINQRGLTKYTALGYTVDRWFKNSSDSASIVSITNDGLALATLENNTDVAKLRQFIENPSRLAGKTVTFSFCAKWNTTNSIASIAYRDENNVWSEIARSTFPPSNEFKVYSLTTTIPETINDKMTLYVDWAGTSDTTNNPIYLKWAKLELGSVATLFMPSDPATELAKCQRYYQVHSTGDIAPVDLRPSMCAVTDIIERADGNYGYVADL